MKQIRMWQSVTVSLLLTLVLVACNSGGETATTTESGVPQTVATNTTALTPDTTPDATEPQTSENTKPVTEGTTTVIPQTTTAPSETTPEETTVASLPETTVPLPETEPKPECAEHDFGDPQVIAATCTQKGKMIYTCRNCDATKETSVAALGHDFGDWEVVTEPTCLADGVNQRVCAHDSAHVETQSVSGDHRYVLYECKWCKDVKSIGSLAFEKTSDGKGYRVVGQNAWSSVIVVPPTYNGLPVTEIASEAFYGSPVRVLILPHTLTTIGRYAFCESALNTVVLPESLTSIGDSAFSSCKGLTEVYNLSALPIQLGGTDYGNVARYATILHTDREAGERLSVTDDGFVFAKEADGYVLLAYSGNAKQLVLPDTYNGHSYKVGAYAFFALDITSLTIGSGVTAIGEAAFSSCQSLTGTLVIPDTVKVLETNAFIACENITAVVIGNGIEVIKESAFDGCERVTSITLGSGVKRIAWRAFGDIKALKTITMCKGIEYIDANAFTQNNELTIYYNGTVGDWCNMNIEYYNALKGTLYINGELLQGEVTVPEGVEAMRGQQFGYIRKITSITIADSVTSLNLYGFISTCPDLVSLTIGKGVKEIDAFDFKSYADDLETIAYRGTKDEFLAVLNGYNPNRDDWGIGVSCSDGDLEL